MEYCNVDSDNIDRYVLFYPVLEFVVSDFLSNKALLLPDLYQKFEAFIKSLKEPEDKIGEPSPIRGNKFSHLSLEDSRKRVMKPLHGKVSRRNCQLTVF